jgi:tRNA-splicing ligase RtcB
MNMQTSQFELLHAEGSTTPIKGWVRGVPLEDQAHEQLRNIASIPFVGPFGTLGGGNHFIELCLDEAMRVWVMLHSGSRGVGNLHRHATSSNWREEDMRVLGFQPAGQGPRVLHGRRAAVRRLRGAVSGRRTSRARTARLMMARVLHEMRHRLPKFQLEKMAVNCHHNYVQKETHFGVDVLVTRKGAVSARAGELGIIPGSMGAKSFIVRGKGNADSFHSCSHGAGRVMSRTKARGASPWRSTGRRPPTSSAARTPA